MEGWIRLHRKLLDCEIWIDDSEKYDRRSAWIDLLLLANHRDKQILFDGKPITVKRGQYITSVRKLAVRWGWGNQKTLTFLRLLCDLGMVTKESDSRRTLVTIVNYEVYQGDENTNGTRIDTQSERKSTTNKKVKNEKNINKYIVGQTNDDIHSIVDYLNEKSGRSFRYTDKTVGLIKARMNQGFTIEDFKKVIDTKCHDWLNDSNMQQYIRPETLFGNKFEGYLNQKKATKQVNKANSFTEMIHTDYDFEALEKQLLGDG